MPTLITIPMGQRFGRLVYLGDQPKGQRGRRALFRCDCGTEIERYLHDVRSEHCLSCGCLHKEVIRSAKSHGETTGRRNTSEYRAWKAMKGRCLYPKSINYHNYGGRGIKIHPEWVNDFAAFLAHVGRKPSPGHTLDRIEVNGNYEPGNVRWATRIEQRRNTRNVHPVTIDGDTKLICDWAQVSGVPEESIAGRIRNGWDERRAVFAPVKRLRNPRKPRFGGHTVEKRHRGDPAKGLYVYRVLVNGPSGAEGCSPESPGASGGNKAPATAGGHCSDRPSALPPCRPAEEVRDG